MPDLIGIEKYSINHINRLNNMSGRLALGYTLSTKDLFRSFPTNKLKLTYKQHAAIRNKNGRRVLMVEVFSACIALVLDDIIENNVIFQLPTKSKKSEIRMKRYEGDKFVECRKHGKFSKVNFLTSNFTGYQLELWLQTAGVMRSKPIYLNGKRKDRITELTNQGKSYY